MPIVRILLLPFAFLYELITDLRNYLYKVGIKESFSFEPFLISVGNLTVGGTGKTPMVELLIRQLSPTYNVAVLSRGYKRKTKGIRIADDHDNSETLGDEPFQYFTKFGQEIMVVVGENRALAIQRITDINPTIDVIILDDAYQHRSVKPDLNMLLNDYNRPFYSDFVMPAGLLRESRWNANRCDVVVTTKCPDTVEAKEINRIKTRICRYAGERKPVYFTGIKYHEPKKIYGNHTFSKNVVLFTGIANAQPLENYVKKHFNLIEHIQFSDHYAFKKEDLSKLISAFNAVDIEDKCLLTTEKDMVRLVSMQKEAGLLMNYPVYYLPIELYFLENGDFFAKYLHNRVEQRLKEKDLK